MASWDASINLSLPPQVFLDVLAVRHIADHAKNLRAILGVQRAERNVHRELAAVDAAGPQVETGAHRPHGGFGSVMFAVLRVMARESGVGTNSSTVFPSKSSSRQRNISPATSWPARSGLRDRPEGWRPRRPRRSGGTEDPPAPLPARPDRARAAFNSSTCLRRDRQPEQFAGVQAIRRAFQHAVHQQPRIGVAAQNNQRDRLAANPRNTSSAARQLHPGAEYSVSTRS